MMFHVGDRVRLMSGREEGTVTRVLENGDVLEVAIDGEFTIPLRRSDVVPIAAEEIKAFGARPAPPPVAPPKPGSSPKAPAAPARPANKLKHVLPGHHNARAPTGPVGPTGSVVAAPPPPGSPVPPTTPVVPAPALAPAASVTAKAPAPTGAPGPPLASVSAKAPEKVPVHIPVNVPARAPAPLVPGAYLVLTHQAEELLAVQLVNFSDDDLLFTYGEEKQDRYLGRKSGAVAPRAAVVLAHLHMHDFEAWPAVVVQYLSHRAETLQLQALETARVRFKASTFYNSRAMAPVLRQEGYVFRLPEYRLVAAGTLPALDAADAVRLAERLNSPAAVPGVKLVAPPHEVDLHLDQLADAPTDEVSNAEAIRRQMAAFQDALDRAVATNMHEIIFIHGVGSGALRKEIHRNLSRDARIKFFEEAQKEKFGFGATRVRLK